MGKSRKHEVQALARRIQAEIDSGRVDDVELDDETVEKVAGLLAPSPGPPSDRWRSVAARSAAVAGFLVLGPPLDYFIQVVENATGVFP